MKRTSSPFSLAWVRVWLPPLLAASLFSIALWVLHRELSVIEYRDVRDALGLLQIGQVVLAITFVAASYFSLTMYDQLAFLRLRIPIARWRVGAAAFAGCAVSNGVGFALLSGTAVRHRFYSRWDVSMADLARIVGFNSITFWLGLLTLGGWSLVLYPGAYVDGGLSLTGARWMGVLAAIVVVTYLLVCATRKAPFRVYGYQLPIPSLSIALGQVVVSIGDWALAAAALFSLVPAGGPPYVVILSAFLAAQGLGLISNVPGGLGVFEATIVLLLGPYLPAGQIIAGLLLYRMMYNVVPLTLALVLLLVDELRSRREQLAELGKLLGDYSVYLGPRILAVFTFMGGLVLLVSMASPAVAQQNSWPAVLLPDVIFEVSHFFVSLIGVSVLVLAQAVSRRVKRSYYIVAGLLLAGIAVLMLLAVDWRAYALLLLLLLIVVPSRSFFDRPVALFDTRFSPGWIVAIALAYASTFWLGAFVFREIPYSGDLWRLVGPQHDISRFLRSITGGGLALAGFVVWRLVLPFPHIAELPNDADLADARRIIDAQAETTPFLVYLRDKALLFNTDRTAFIMYGVRGRTWAALGDPVGPTRKRAALVRAFIERAYDYGGLPMFFETHPSHLDQYVDLGMTFVKLGEEGRVSLEDPVLVAQHAAELRTLAVAIGDEQLRFRVVGTEAIARILPQLKRVSDEWLDRVSVKEKGFSLGFFDREYLRFLPIAVLERGDRIIAFANLLCSPTGEELSIDLMRFDATAPRGAMDFLFYHMLVWGHGQGYHWFNLGMAPTSPLWMRVGRFVYRHGDAFDSLESLRAYKEKFHPVWEPRFLAFPSGTALPVMLADVAALAAGGYVKIFR